MEAFPEAKVVLNVRDPDTYYKSIRWSIYEASLQMHRFVPRVFLWLTGESKNVNCVVRASRDLPHKDDVFEEGIVANEFAKKTPQNIHIQYK